MRYKLSCGLLFTALAGLGQPLAFEVASVKPAAPVTSKAMMEGSLRLGIQIDAGKVEMHFVSLSDLVRVAYRLKAYQVTGPDWIASERYDVIAKIPSGSSKDQVPEMLQTLLAERFKLTLHHDNKEHQVYALVQSKGGSKLKEVEPDPPAAPGDPTATSGPSSFSFGGKGSVTSTTSGGGSGGSAMVFSRTSDGATKTSGPNGTVGGLHVDRKMTMPIFCEFLARFMDKPVVDQTELKATYQVVLDLPLDEIMKSAKANGGAVVVMNGGGPMPSAGGDSASDPSGGSALFGMVQQMGLKLEQRKTPMDILVVDQAEKVPTEN